jgi:hypothetical protein
MGKNIQKSVWSKNLAVILQAFKVSLKEKFSIHLAGVSEVLHCVGLVCKNIGGTSLFFFFLGLGLYLIMPCLKALRWWKVNLSVKLQDFQEFIFWDIALYSLLKVGQSALYPRRLNFSSLLWEPWLLYTGILSIDVMVKWLNGHLQ